MHISDLLGIGLTEELAIMEQIGLCLGALGETCAKKYVFDWEYDRWRYNCQRTVICECVANKVFIPAASVMDL